MTPALHYFYGIAKALAPPLIPWATKMVAHMRITHPEDNAIVTAGPIRVCGRYRFECGLSFVLLYHCGSQYWPQGSPVFDRTRHTWEKEVYVKRVGNDRHFISVASLDVDARPEMRQQVLVLEDESDDVAVKPIAVRAPDPNPVDLHLARGWAVQIADDRQERGLAGAGRAGEHDELARLEPQRNAVDSHDRARKYAPDVLYDDVCPTGTILAISP